MNKMNGMSKRWKLLSVLLILGMGYAHGKEKAPRLSIIASVHNDGQFIRGFLENITSLESFEEYELLLFHPPSSGNEEYVINEFERRFDNIRYIKLESDPGVYAIWNYGIQIARAPYLTNANLDDRRHPTLIEEQLAYLDEHEEIDLVYSDYMITEVPNETFLHNTAQPIHAQEFSAENMKLCLPGSGPIWRKSMHEKYGVFRDDFTVAGAWEYWNRAVSKGSQFYRLQGIGILSYQNPLGLVNNPEPDMVATRVEENEFVIAAYAYLWNAVEAASPRLLIKIPTRSRREQFFNRLDEYYRNLSGQVRYQFLISCDTDDTQMNNEQVKKRLGQYPNLTVYFDDNVSKVSAYNQGIAQQAFDMVLATADDMEPVQKGYDKVIVDAMVDHFPDFDGVLNYNDGHVGSALATYPIVGRIFYERFGYLFHPFYQSLFVNDELTMTARILGKEFVSDQVLLQHNHPAWSAGVWDELYRRNEGFKDIDQGIFSIRRKNNFYIDDRWFDKKWSILICTLEDRRDQFNALYAELERQLNETGLRDSVEILYYRDNKEKSIGFKRNALMRQARGKYVSFIDDDDTVHEQYIAMVYEKLQNDPDSVSLRGLYTARDGTKSIFEHSRTFGTRYTFEDGRYIRPPNHLNPIRKAIAAQFLFPEINFREDEEWTMAVAHSGLIKTEEIIDEIYYFYDKSIADSRSVPEKAVIKENNLLYFCTAADEPYYDLVLNLIGSIHANNFDNLGGIIVGNIGMNEGQIRHLRSIEKVDVVEVEKVNEHILERFLVANWGKSVPGWYTWKPVVVKQSLDVFPYVLWIDASAIVLKPIDNLFKHIKSTGYFLATIGDENSPPDHPLAWSLTDRLTEAYKLDTPERAPIKNREQVMSTVVGVTRQTFDLFARDWYQAAKDISLFADDGSTKPGFGTARHDQAVLTILAYINGLTVHDQDYRQINPMKLEGIDEPLHITWHGGFVNDNTHIYTARRESRSYDYFQNEIRYISAAHDGEINTESEIIL